MENFEHNKYTGEDINFFSGLAQKYGLEESPDHLIVNDGKRKIFIPKQRLIITKHGNVTLEDFIARTFEEIREGKI